MSKPPSLAPTNLAPPSLVPSSTAKPGKRVALYGTGGIGKTTLAARAPGRIAFYDLDESLDALEIPIAARPVSNWAELRADIQSLRDIDTIVIDSVTRAEEWAVAHTIATVPHEKGYAVKRIEDYGFGKGFQHVFDTFLPLFADLDAQRRRGVNIVLVLHECMSQVPNPQGDDYIRYEPRLQNPTSGKASLRLRLKEWVDNLVFIGFDVDVRDNKARGSGTRTIYPIEMPHCMAKSRNMRDQLVYDDGSDELWAHLKLNGTTASATE